MNEPIGTPPPFPTTGNGGPRNVAWQPLAKGGPPVRRLGSTDWLTPGRSDRDCRPQL